VKLPGRKFPTYIFPRFKGDGFGLRFDPSYSQLPPREALEAAATQIRAALGKDGDAV